MKNRINKTLLVFLLVSLFSFRIQAQDKYEFAIVRQISNVQITISIEGKPYESQKLPFDFKIPNDFTHLYAVVAKLQHEGWEVFTTYDTVTTYQNWTTFVLRKKKS